MVAYSFKAQFEDRIKDGSKKFTIRLRGKRIHAVEGKQLQYYFGMRTKHCRKICEDKPCKSSHDCLLHFEHGELVGAEVDGRSVVDLETFAQWDGFDDLQSMTLFWQQTHGATDYTGATKDLVLINWAADLEELF